MDPTSLMLILGLVERMLTLAPKVVDLIQRVRAGEKITPEEVEATEALVRAAVDRWNKSGSPPAKE